MPHDLALRCTRGGQWAVCSLRYIAAACSSALDSQSVDNLADFFTKFLEPKEFMRLRNKIMNYAQRLDD